MAKKNFYAVAVGRTPGIYKTWGEAEPQVKGFQGAKYQGFATEDEAKAFMDNPEYKTKESQSVKPVSEDVTKNLQDLGILPSTENSQNISLKNETNSDYDAIIYVDGSYRPSDLEGGTDAGSKEGAYAYGMKVIDRTGTHYFARAFEPDKNSSMRNVAGEVNGATAAIHYAVDHNYSKIHLLYDYNGIEAWCKPTQVYNKQGQPVMNANGSPKIQNRWSRNLPATQAYAELYDNVKDKLHIDFEHVYGHTGVDGNEVCDALAKSVLHISDSKLKTYAKEIESAKPYISNSERIIKSTLSRGNQFLESEDMSSKMDRTFE